jgi:hypothetical protein
MPASDIKLVDTVVLAGLQEAQERSWLRLQALIAVKEIFDYFPAEP